MATVITSQTATASLIPAGQDFLPSSQAGSGWLIQNHLSIDRIREVLVRKQIEGLKAWFELQVLPSQVRNEASRLLDALVSEYSSVSRQGELYLLPIPVGSWREDGHAMLSWDHGIHHFEAELLPEGSVEWFYRNREGSEPSWETESEFGANLPDGVLARLDRLRSR